MSASRVVRLGVSTPQAGIAGSAPDAVSLDATDREQFYKRPRPPAHKALFSWWCGWHSGCIHPE
jgi:hypothetical protein